MQNDAMKLIIKINSNEFKNSSRDERELNVYKNLGASVLVVAKGPQDKHKQIEQVNGFNVMRLGTRPFSFLPNFANRLISVFIWAKIINKLNADVLSGRDLEGLLIAYISTLFVKKTPTPRIVYDSHEFEMGRNRVLNSKIKTTAVKTIEKFLISKCCLAIFVSDSISDKVVETYKLSTPTIVVRNIPSKWRISNDEIKKRKIELQSFFQKEYFIVMYHGALLPHRGIENILEATSRFPDVACVLLGMADSNYLTILKRKTASLKINERVYFHDAVALENLGSYIASTNVGFSTIEPQTLSYYYSLPNKLFENIQALTPIIVSNFPDMASLVNKYKIGIAVNPLSVDEIESAIKKLKDEPVFYHQLKENLKVAQTELCWEVERTKLIEAYYKYY